MTTSANNHPTERPTTFAEIVRTIPGNGSEPQRNRMLAAMQRMGSVTSYEGSRFLDCYDPRARIHELRLAGYRIATHSRAMPTESGELRYVGVYVLEAPTTYPLFAGLDDEQAPP